MRAVEMHALVMGGAPRRGMQFGMQMVNATAFKKSGGCNSFSVCEALFKIII